jgi:SAM-dependent methyltransferase
MAEFDEYASSYEEEVWKGIGFARAEHAVYLEAKANVLLGLISRSGSPTESSVLDVGCGVGSFTRQLVGGIAELHGCDPSAEAVARASRDIPDATFAVSGKYLPYADGRFDAVCAVCVFHHVPPGDRRKLAREMARVAKPGALVVIFEHNPWNPLTRLVVRRIPFDSGAKLISAGQARGLLRAADLTAIGSRYIMFVPSVSRKAALAERGLGWLPAGAQYYACGLSS